MKVIGKHSYFLIYAIIGFIATIVGFASTYIVPMSQGVLDVPIGIHIHGAFAFAWILLYLLQNVLIKYKNYKLHMSMGVLAVIVLIGFALSLIPAAGFTIARDVSGFGDSAYSATMSVLTSGIWVLGLGTAGIIYRKKPAIHKRLMFLATAVILWPAWARWRHYFPSIENGDWWFGLAVPYTFIVLAWLWELTVYKKIHPVLLVIGALIISEGLLSSYYIESESIIRFMKWLFHL